MRCLVECAYGDDIHARPHVDSLDGSSNYADGCALVALLLMPPSVPGRLPQSLAATVPSKRFFRALNLPALVGAVREVVTLG